MLTVGSLFAGIGGFDLGLERAGMQVKWQVEIDPYCLKVLEKHWPHVRRYTDIKTVDWSTVEPVDLVCGGFPCQDLSVAGKRAGIDGERSGLWSEYVRCLRTLRPRYVLVENVPGLLINAAMGRVLGDLADCGYDAEWQIISAAAVGAPHLRNRIWILAYAQHPDTDSKRSHRTAIDKHGSSEFRDKQISVIGSMGEALADSNQPRSQGRIGAILSERPSQWTARPSSPFVADASIYGQSRCGDARTRRDGFENGGQAVSDAASGSKQRSGPQCDERRLQNETLRSLRHTDYWQVEPNVGRVAHGVPSRVDRLRGLGNSIVPQCVTWLGERILEHDKAMREMRNRKEVS